MNALIGVGAFIVVLTLVGVFVLRVMNSDKPKEPSVRRRELRRAQTDVRRARVTIHDIRARLLKDDAVTLDPVGYALRNELLNIINDYETQQLQNED